MKTEQEINAEKAAKPRPDLLPARALQAIDRAMPETDYTSDRDHVLDALRELIAFRESCGVARLAVAAVHVAWVLGEPECDGAFAFACMAGGRVMGYGFRKHGNCTWRVAGTEQADPQTHVASAERHLLEYLIDPEAREDGSGLPVLEHAFSQLCITIDLVLDPPALQGKNDGHGTVTGRLAAAADEPERPLAVGDRVVIMLGRDSILGTIDSVDETDPGLPYYVQRDDTKACVWLHAYEVRRA